MFLRCKALSSCSTFNIKCCSLGSFLEVSKWRNWRRVEKITLSYVELIDIVCLFRWYLVASRNHLQPNGATLDELSVAGYCKANILAWRRSVWAKWFLYRVFVVPHVYSCKDTVYRHRSVHLLLLKLVAWWITVLPHVNPLGSHRLNSRMKKKNRRFRQLIPCTSFGFKSMETYGKYNSLTTLSFTERFRLLGRSAWQSVSILNFCHIYQKLTLSAQIQFGLLLLSATSANVGSSDFRHASFIEYGHHASTSNLILTRLPMYLL